MGSKPSNDSGISIAGTGAAAAGASASASISSSSSSSTPSDTHRVIITCADASVGFDAKLPRKGTVLETGPYGVIRVDRITEAFRTIPYYRRRGWPSDACAQLAALLRDNPRTRDVIYSRARITEMFYDVFTVPKSSDDAADAVAAIANVAPLPHSMANSRFFEAIGLGLGKTIHQTKAISPRPGDDCPRPQTISPVAKIPKRHRAIDTAPYSKRSVDKDSQRRAPSDFARGQERTIQEWKQVMLDVGCSGPTATLSITRTTIPLDRPSTCRGASASASTRAKAATDDDIACCTRILHRAITEIRAEQQQGCVAPPPSPDADMVDSDRAAAAEAKDQGGCESRFSEYIKEMLARMDAEDKLRQLTTAAATAVASDAVQAQEQEQTPAETPAKRESTASGLPPTPDSAALPSILSFMGVFGDIPRRCVACLCAKADHVATPCGHALYCDDCKDSWFLRMQGLLNCPICNTRITVMIRVRA